MKLTWDKCGCGSKSCDRWIPREIGFFYAGSGFSSQEKRVLEKAFAPITEEQFREMMK